MDDYQAEISRRRQPVGVHQQRVVRAAVVVAVAEGVVIGHGGRQGVGRLDVEGLQADHRGDALAELDARHLLHLHL